MSKFIFDLKDLINEVKSLQSNNINDKSFYFKYDFKYNHFLNCLDEDLYDYGFDEDLDEDFSDFDDDASDLSSCDENDNEDLDDWR